MSKKTGTTPAKRGTKTPFQVKPVRAAEIAAIVLEELSHHYGDTCNYLDAVKLVRAGHIYLGYLSVSEQNAGRVVTTAREHWVQNQALSVLKKLVDPEFDRWASTKSKWFSTENRCRRLNQKFEALINRRARAVKPVPYARESYRFYEAIIHAIGEAPPLDEIAEEAHYGPGSTVSVRGREVHFVRKLEANECVPAAIDLAVQSLMHDKAVWAHVGMDPVYAQNLDAQEGFRRVMRERLSENAVRHDRLMFIHKNIESLRSIGAQPTCSGMLQLGVHSVVSRSLLRMGVDLADQSWNQRLARKGSTDWQRVNPLCTLDKSDASNLIAKMLVVSHFPPAWAKLLMRIRTPGYVAPPELGGENHDYEMYAGMGNGTTFVVETLIFWAAAYATSESGTVEDFVNKRDYAVYGDDVILPRDHAKRYMRYARFLGLKFNTKKTFLDGPFRESCGSDYFEGIPVRPATLDCDSAFIGHLNLIGFHNTLADGHFTLKSACARIRSVYSRSVYPLVPTDPSGNLGFRPIDVPYYSVVKTRGGTVPVSPAWQRPRTYMIEVNPLHASLGVLDSWTQIAVSLLRARQGQRDPGAWSLPTRERAEAVRVIPESDLVRKDLVTMLKNQLVRLSINKTKPWWEASRGLVEGK